MSFKEFILEASDRKDGYIYKKGDNVYLFEPGTKMKMGVKIDGSLDDKLKNRLESETYERIKKLSDGLYWGKMGRTSQGIFTEDKLKKLDLKKEFETISKKLEDTESGVSAKNLGDANVRKGLRAAKGAKKSHRERLYAYKLFLKKRVKGK